MILRPLFRPPNGWLSPQQIMARVKEKVKQRRNSMKVKNKFKEEECFRQMRTDDKENQDISTVELTRIAK